MAGGVKMKSPSRDGQGLAALSPPTPAPQLGTPLVRPACYTAPMERLHKGDRVRAGFARYGLQVSVTGTIRRVFRATPDSYEVAFDGVRRPVVMYGRDLERVDAVP